MTDHSTEVRRLIAAGEPIPPELADRVRSLDLSGVGVVDLGSVTKLPNLRYLYAPFPKVVGRAAISAMLDEKFGADGGAS
jgi:hypothetical protein